MVRISILVSAFKLRHKRLVPDLLARNSIKSLVVTPAMLVRPSNEPNVDMITGFPLPARFSSERIRKIADQYS